MPSSDTATITPAAIQNGSGTLTFTVIRSDGAVASTTLPVSVTKVNLAPILTPLGNQAMVENSTLPVRFFVTELGDPLSDVSVAAYSANSAVVANTGLTFQSGPSVASPVTVAANSIVGLGNFASTTAPNAADVELVVSPIASALGSTEITVWATNTDSAGVMMVSEQFALTVSTELFKPVFASCRPPSL